MSTTESLHRRRRRRSEPGTAGSRTPTFRTAVACAIGLFVVGGAYQVCFAQTGVGVSVTYGGGGGGGGGNGGGGGEDNGGLSSLEIAGIAVGGAAVIALATGAFAGHGAGAAAGGVIPIGGTAECKEQYPPLPSDQTRISEIKLSPSDSRIERGYARCFYLNVKGEDGKWYSVTQRAESRIELKEPDICLTKMDGTKNIFMVPASTPQSCDGKTVELVGTFAPSGQSPYTATATVHIRVPNQ